MPRSARRCRRCPSTCRLDDGATDETAVGDALMALVAHARAGGVDPEQALRRAVARYADQVRTRETGVVDEPT